MANQSVYSVLLSMGAPPEYIQRIMSQMQGTSMFDTRASGFRGNLATPFTARPKGIYASPNPPRA